MPTLNDMLGQYVQHTSRISSLWTVFVAATFAAAGFNGLADPAMITERAFLSAGYLAFSIGHWVLLHHAIDTSRQIATDIDDFLDRHPDFEFRASAARIVAHKSSLRVSLAAHLVIDLSVLAIIWHQAISSIL